MVEVHQEEGIWCAEVLLGPVVEISDRKRAWIEFATDAIIIKIQQVLWSILNLRTDNWGQYVKSHPQARNCRPKESVAPTLSI